MTAVAGAHRGHPPRGARIRPPTGVATLFPCPRVFLPAYRLGGEEWVRWARNPFNPGGGRQWRRAGKKREVRHGGRVDQVPGRDARPPSRPTLFLRHKLHPRAAVHPGKGGALAGAGTAIAYNAANEPVWGRNASRRLP